jgi:hypothetical protein
MVFCGLGIKADFHPIFPRFNLIRRIHSQLTNRSAPYRRSTQQLEPSNVEIKMLVPLILPGVEEHSLLAAFWIYARNVSPSGYYKICSRELNSLVRRRPMMLAE